MSGSSSKVPKQGRVWLLGIAAATVLSFGVRPQTAAGAIFWWMVRAGGASCAVMALCRTPKLERYDPIADLTTAHRFQLARLQEQHQEVILQLQFQKLDEIAQLQTDLENQYQRDLEQAMQQYLAQLAIKDTELSQLQQQLIQQQAHYEAEQSRIGQSYQRQWERLEIQMAEIEATKNQLKAERDALHQWADEQSIQLAQQQQQQNEELERRRQQAEVNLDEQRQLMIAQFEQQWDKMQQLAQQEIENHKRIIADLESMVESQRLYIYNLQQPEYTNGTTTEELLADRVIGYLYEQGIIVRSPGVAPYGKHKFRLAFGVLPIAPGKNKDNHYATSLIDAYKRLEKLKDGIRGVIPGCRSAPEVEIFHRQIRLSIDTSGVDWEAEAQRRSDPIIEPAPEHFATFIESCYHIGLFGPTRIGKTITMNNILGAMQQRLGDTAELIVGDAKLSTALKALKPRYLGARECLIGLREAADEIQRRIDLREADYRTDRPLTDFSNDQRIYFFDEINEVVARFNTPVDPADVEWLKDHDFPLKYAVSTYLFRIWRMGAELGILSLIAGQNLMANVLKINIVDLENLGLMFMGGAISVGIQYRCKGGEKTEMEEQYRLRRERYFKTKDTRFKHYGFFCLPNEKPYFAGMPAPETYVSAPAIVLPTETEDEAEDEFLLDSVQEAGAELETPDADDGAAGEEAGAAPPYDPTAPEVVQRLEELLHLEFPAAHPADSPAPSAPPDPLAPGISAELVQQVLREFDRYQSQGKVIASVWGVSKSGTSLKYRAAKWKFRYILHQQGRKLPGKPWGEDVDDLKSFDELIGE